MMGTAADSINRKIFTPSEVLTGILLILPMPRLYDHEIKLNVPNSFQVFANEARRQNRLGKNLLEPTYLFHSSLAHAVFKQSANRQAFDLGRMMVKTPF